MSHMRAQIHTPTGYRLRILRANDLPLHTTSDGLTFEFQLGISLYDEAYGAFYGNTVSLCSRLKHNWHVFFRVCVYVCVYGHK